MPQPENFLQTSPPKAEVSQPGEFQITKDTLVQNYVTRHSTPPPAPLHLTTSRRYTNACITGITISLQEISDRVSKRTGTTCNFLTFNCALDLDV